jgi:hypothetical protein
MPFPYGPPGVGFEEGWLSRIPLEEVRIGRGECPEALERGVQVAPELERA